jgi:hypothetical protein
MSARKAWHLVLSQGRRLSSSLHSTPKVRRLSMTKLNSSAKLTWESTSSYAVQSRRLGRRTTITQAKQPALSNLLFRVPPQHCLTATRSARSAQCRARRQGKRAAIPNRQ